jgi:2-polyprenyl-3-methyl-5-hydroxy-6-metoxy-1,4-benzoquinol methylase
VKLVIEDNCFKKNLTYYRQHTAAYIEETITLDMQPELDTFLDLLGKDGHILDVGCGSGRDSRFFIEHGYTVTAIDATPEIAEQTSIYLGHNVVVQAAQEINSIEEFDGVWACASLLHIPEEELLDTFVKIFTALKPEGVWYMSFKHGNGEQWDNRGRFFNYHTADSIKKIILQLPGIEIVSISEDTKKLRGNPQCWVNIFVMKNKA